MVASTEDVPSLADVKEKLRSEELRQKQAGPGHEDDQGKALAASHGPRHSFTKSKLTCHFCGKPGHFKRDCRKWAAEKKKKNEQSTNSDQKQSANPADSEASDDDTESMMITTHTFSTVSN